MRGKRTWTAVLFGLLMVFALGIHAAAAESVVIPNFSITVTKLYGDDEILEPTVELTSKYGCTIDNIIWNKDLEDWKPGRKVRANITMSSGDKIFQKSYNSTECKVKGAQFVSAKAIDNYTLEVRVDYLPVVNLGFTDQAGWGGTDSKTAIWKTVSYATGYKLNLYADGKKVKSLTVQENYADLSEYMTKEADYYYEVQAVPYSSEDKKYMKQGALIASDNIPMEFEGDTTGKWNGNTYKEEDGNIPKSSWKQILDKWYYFDKDGNRVTGWLQMGERWYYMAADGSMLTGWVESGGKWYYMNPNGGEMMTSCWIQSIPGKWYYLYADGTMATSAMIGPYWVDQTGLWVTTPY